MAGRLLQRTYRRETFQPRISYGGTETMRDDRQGTIDRLEKECFELESSNAALRREVGELKDKFAEEERLNLEAQTYQNECLEVLAAALAEAKSYACGNEGEHSDMISLQNIIKDKSAALVVITDELTEARKDLERMVKLHDLPPP